MSLVVGGIKCFQVAKEFLDGFAIPAALVAGNHDLEGEEFETDEENLLAWQQVRSQVLSLSAFFQSGSNISRDFQQKAAERMWAPWLLIVKVSI